MRLSRIQKKNVMLDFRIIWNIFREKLHLNLKYEIYLRKGTLKFEVDYILEKR